MQPGTRSDLELFLEKVQRVSERRFVKQIIEQGGLSVSLSARVGEPVTTSTNLPDQEATDALALTLRMFVQNNDRISLGRLGAIGDPEVSQRWKDLVQDVRTRLNAYLDESHPMIKVKSLDGSLPTRRDLFETILYGDLSHANAQKRQQVLAWREMGPLMVFIDMAFKEIVLEVINAASYVAAITKLELKGEEIPLAAGEDDPPHASASPPAAPSE